jgi:hypothetical protein
MPSGGARARSGPAPDPQALRRSRKDDAGWETLPGPREGDAPEWPEELAGASVSELAMWSREWRRPQARKWEVNGQEFEVAMYVRTFISAAMPDASANMRALVVRQQETLGISLSGLARNRWIVGEQQESVGAPAERAVAGEAKRRFTVVRGGNADAA